MKVGVYGTLKRGFWNHRLLRGSDYIRDAVVSGFRLYESGIPFAMEDEASPYPLSIEVYRVDDTILQRLDMLEGHPTAYERKPFNVDGDEVWIYTYNHEGVTQHTTLNTTGVYPIDR
jgi:gamma-glutamylcyclotransferase (GGCT)/AIG2-like uncharacterized protein YtfP